MELQRELSAAQTRFREALIGLWRLDRRVLDAITDSTAIFTGEARLIPEEEDLRYEEEGVLNLGGLATRSSRVFLWRFPASGLVEVQFENGQKFHEFDPSDPRPAAVHEAEPERYEVAYRFDFENGAWSSVWRVEGPRKNYRMENRLQRP